MTLIKYDHLQVIGTITGKFLKTVEDAETRLCLPTDGQTNPLLKSPSTNVGGQNMTWTRLQTAWIRKSVYNQPWDNVIYHQMWLLFSE